MSRRGPLSNRRGAAVGEAVRLKPADPFDLIRWLARSQGDPRKAIAELVQNSLDANASRITIERRRVGGNAAISVVDDGEGVLPDMPREEALRHLAQHIGHSRKAKLTPTERRERIIAGKYGVGLLGFWSIGHRFELRSRVGGGSVWGLLLVEDEPGGRIVEVPAEPSEPETFTEALVLDVHDTALRVLGGPRLASYLGSELRGQLLTRSISLRVHDGLARGLAQKHFDVKPRRYLGEPLDLPTDVPVEGRAPMRVELYLARGESSAAVQIACAGTVVAESVRELGGLEIPDAPWIGRELVGMLDFPELNVPPGTRRGVVPDEAAFAFVAALEALRPKVERELARFERERGRASQRDLAKDLRRALRGLVTRLPQYELPSVSGDGDGEIASGAPAKSRREAGTVEADADVSPTSAGVSSADEASAEDDDDPYGPVEDVEAASLFAPDTIVTARIVPAQVKLRPGGERRVRAEARDEDARVIRRPLRYTWRVEGADALAAVEVRGDGPRPAIATSPDARAGTVAGALHVEVEELDGSGAARASAKLFIDDTDDASLFDQGIPEPLFETDPRGLWRSRFEGGRWVVNDAHEDWMALSSDPRARLRYVLSLFAKDVVLRSFAPPGSGAALEKMIDVLAHAERNLRGT